MSTTLSINDIKTADDVIIGDGSWINDISWKSVGKATYTGMSSRNQRRNKLERKITQETANRMHLKKIDTFFLPVDDGARINVLSKFLKSISSLTVTYTKKVGLLIIDYKLPC